MAEKQYRYVATKGEFEGDDSDWKQLISFAQRFKRVSQPIEETIRFTATPTQVWFMINSLRIGSGGICIEIDATGSPEESYD